MKINTADQPETTEQIYWYNVDGELYAYVKPNDSQDSICDSKGVAIRTYLNPDQYKPIFETIRTFRILEAIGWPTCVVSYFFENIKNNKYYDRFCDGIFHHIEPREDEKGYVFSLNGITYQLVELDKEFSCYGLCDANNEELQDAELTFYIARGIAACPGYADYIGLCI